MARVDGLTAKKPKSKRLLLVEQRVQAMQAEQLGNTQEPKELMTQTTEPERDVILPAIDKQTSLHETASECADFLSFLHRHLVDVRDKHRNARGAIAVWERKLRDCL
jgi:hypothetical protein